MAGRGRGEPAMSTTKNTTSMELVSDREVVIARTFNGRASTVYEAWTNAELVARWWAPKSLGVSVVSCEADVRVGGKYRYVLENRDGSEIAFSGEYTELTPYSRIVYTQVFEGYPGPAMTITITLEEHGGKTRLVAHEVYPSAEARDAALGSGMEHGMRETMDQLDELVASLG